jgi:ligand-binding SRPBCC domain-containing protein
MDYHFPNKSMPLIQIETWIHAPIERVFDLARSIDAHMASTGGTGEKAVAGRTTGLIGQGETVTWEARHLGVKQRLSVRITACERPYLLRDEMIQGAFATMDHTHRFSEDHDGTLMKDDFHFTAPLGFLGRIAETLFLKSYMKHFLTQRAQVLKRMAEGEEWRYYLKNDHLQPSPTP